MLANDWKEAHERRINLPEAQPEMLEIYLHWIYTGHLIVENTRKRTVSWQLVKLYILGDYLNDAAFCESVINRIVDRSQGSEGVDPNHVAITLAWDSTPTDSPLRLVIKELWLGRTIASAIKAFGSKQYTPDFVLDILARFLSNNEELCKRTFSGKTAEQIRESCKDHVKALRPEQQT